MPVSLELDNSTSDNQAYPITVQLARLDENAPTPSLSHPSSTPNGLFRSNLTADVTDSLVNGLKTNRGVNEIETVRAKYLLGCDGAHSWVRKQAGIRLEGEQTDYIWFGGQLIYITLTDFLTGACSTLSQSPTFRISATGVPFTRPTQEA